MAREKLNGSFQEWRQETDENIKEWEEKNGIKKAEKVTNWAVAAMVVFMFLVMAWGIILLMTAATNLVL